MPFRNYRIRRTLVRCKKAPILFFVGLPKGPCVGNVVVFL